MRRAARYAELRCQSCFSFLEGASHPEELVARAAELGLSALALADASGLYGIVRAHGEAKRRGLPLVVGAELAVTGLELGRPARLVLLAQRPRGVRGALPARDARARRRMAPGPRRTAPRAAPRDGGRTVPLADGGRARARPLRALRRRGRRRGGAAQGRLRARGSRSRWRATGSPARRRATSPRAPSAGGSGSRWR